MEKSMYFIFILLLCAFPKNIVSRVPVYLTNEGDDNRIIGGYDTTIQQFPYIAHLRLTTVMGDFQCGGSIISTRYILTAAHCLPGVSVIAARVGSSFANSGGTEYRTMSFRGHPLYNTMTFEYDVAYVRLLTAMTIDGINTRIISLAPNNSPVEPGTNLTVSGWGAVIEDGLPIENLKAVQVTVVSNEVCKDSYRTITERTICAGEPEGGKDSCEGDSGGPAVSDDGIQRGIISHGRGCGRPGIPGVYTNVSNVRTWIRRNTGV